MYFLLIIKSKEDKIGLKDKNEEIKEHKKPPNLMKSSNLSGRSK
jgi:hypothetical protein